MPASIPPLENWLVFSEVAAAAEPHHGRHLPVIDDRLVAEPSTAVAEAYGIPTSAKADWNRQRAFEKGALTWVHELVCAVADVMYAAELAPLGRDMSRARLVDLGALVVVAIQDIDRTNTDTELSPTRAMALGNVTAVAVMDAQARGYEQAADRVRPILADLRALLDDGEVLDPVGYLETLAVRLTAAVETPGA